VLGGSPAGDGSDGSGGHEELVASPIAERVLQDRHEHASRSTASIGGGPG
jgi:hypothetical protein